MSALQMKYFVLKPKGTDLYAQASRAAMQAYADHIRKDDPNFAADLDAWIRHEEKSAVFPNLTTLPISEKP